MAYDQSFYDAYAAYLAEPRVRRAHGQALAIASAFPAFRRVVDLGCGRGNEYFHHARPDAYVGMDVNAIPSAAPGKIVLAADYRDPEAIGAEMARHGLTGVVSLFSIECTAARAQNYAFYEALFRKTPAAMVLAAGFYYVHARDQETVGESGGIVSYQTIEPIEDAPKSNLFRETRLVFPCPSSFFGEDVVEVWKILERA